MTGAPVIPRFAGPGRRLAAFGIDVLLVYLVSMIVTLAAMVVGWLPAATSPGAAKAPWQMEAVAYFLSFAVTVALWVRFGGTPGKRLMECRIVDARTLKPVSPGQAVVRCLGYMISALPLGLGFLWIAWDRRKQGFHDKLAGTVVLHDDTVPSLDVLQREVL